MGSTAHRALTLRQQLPASVLVDFSNFPNDTIRLLGPMAPASSLQGSVRQRGTRLWLFRIEFSKAQPDMKAESRRSAKRRSQTDMLCLMRCFVAAMLLVAAIPVGSTERFSMRDLVFLTRNGCRNTDSMRSSLDQALKSLALPVSYELIDLDKLKPTDIRRGYGTPTVLYKNRDLFGMATPSASSNAPS